MGEPLEGVRLHERLGGGPMFDVFRATDADGRQVAVKRARPALARAQDTNALARLRREAEVLREVAHPAVIALLSVGSDGEGVALVLPLLSGGSLADRLAAGTVTDELVASVRVGVAAALAALHAHGWVHGDVKPSNVLFDADGRVVLADLGAARRIGTTDPVHATPGYASPHALAGAPADSRDDLHALGVLLAEVDAVRGGIRTPTPDPGTRDFGPRPTRDTGPVATVRRRPWLLGLAGLVLVAPLVLAVVLLSRPDAPEVVVPTGAPTVAPTDAAVPHTPPSPCADVPTPAGDGDVILGDTRGIGCGLPVRRDGERLVVPDPDGGPDRVYRLATEDQVFLGDWDCDGTDTLAVYRPADGVVSTFAVFPKEVGDEVPSSDRTVVVDGVATHVTVDGCDELRVTADDGT